MGDILKQAGSVVGSIGRATQMILLGVPIPGLLILCELLWIYEPQLPARPSGASLEALSGAVEKSSAFLQKQNGVVIGFVVLLVFCAAYAAGYLNRTIAFALSDIWLRLRGYTMSDMRRLTDRIALIYGPVEVGAVFARYPIFAMGLRDSGEIRMPASILRGYCQMWLRRNAPDLVVDYAEAEINLTLGLLLPTMLLSAPFWTALSATGFPSPLSAGAWSGWLLAVLPILAAGGLFWRITRLRRIEVEHTLANFALAHMDGWAKPKEPPRPAVSLRDIAVGLASAGAAVACLRAVQPPAPSTRPRQERPT